ncbi:hypothetical protein HDU92_001785 [Lobulomyces angularis]|nr:hypothetical protein HDU92_001785 [Lobulomyces angularis]
MDFSTQATFLETKNNQKRNNFDDEDDDDDSTEFDLSTTNLEKNFSSYNEEFSNDTTNNNSLNNLNNIDDNNIDDNNLDDNNLDDNNLDDNNLDDEDIVIYRDDDDTIVTSNQKFSSNQPLPILSMQCNKNFYDNVNNNNAVDKPSSLGVSLCIPNFNKLKHSTSANNNNNNTNEEGHVNVVLDNKSNNWVSLKLILARYLCLN